MYSPHVYTCKYIYMCMYLNGFVLFSLNRGICFWHFWRIFICSFNFQKVCRSVFPPRVVCLFRWNIFRDYLVFLSALPQLSQRNYCVLMFMYVHICMYVCMRIHTSNLLTYMCVCMNVLCYYFPYSRLSSAVKISALTS